MFRINRGLGTITLARKKELLDAMDKVERKRLRQEVPTMRASKAERIAPSPEQTLDDAEESMSLDSSHDLDSTGASEEADTSKRSTGTSRIVAPDSWDDFVAQCKEIPENLEIFARILDGPTAGWDPAIFGDFPESGVLLLYTKLPSSNRSLKSP